MTCAPGSGRRPGYPDRALDARIVLNAHSVGKEWGYVNLFVSFTPEVDHSNCQYSANTWIGISLNSISVTLLWSFISIEVGPGLWESEHRAYVGG
jgi:hypothetical protein